jgi:hypothetical protein
MKTYCLVLLSAFVLMACGKNEAEMSYATLPYSVDISAPPPPPSVEGAGNGFRNEKDVSEMDVITSNNAPQEQAKVAEKIKKTANLSIVVDDYKKVRVAIEQLLKADNAYIGNENEQNSAYSIYNTLLIRVSNKNFESLINKLIPLGRVTSKTISAEDVTAQFIDIQSRIKSKKEIEKRYLDILSKASKVSDVLEIEQKLGEIREQIEAKEGELKYLSDQVDYSSINLTVQQDFEYTPSDKPGFWGRLVNAFINGWHGFLSVLVGFMYAWPLWLILGGGTYLLYRFIKRKTKK